VRRGTIGSESTVFEALAKRFPAPAWALISQVRNSTGYSGDRTCDAIAMSLWPSRGLELHGFEIKCSRGDWLSEMRRPDKADKMFKYFDRWWLAVSDASVVNDYEVPPTWGLIVMDKIKVNAPILAPEPIDRKFLAAIMRRVYETSPEAAINAAFARAKEAGYHEGYDKGSQSTTAQANFNALLKSVKVFQEASGISLQDWDLGNIGRAVRALRDYQPARLQQTFQGLRNQLSVVARGLDDVVAAVGEMEEAGKLERKNAPGSEPLQAPAGGNDLASEL
jgi:hypothetical protein